MAKDRRRSAAAAARRRLRTLRTDSTVETPRDIQAALRAYRPRAFTSDRLTAIQPVVAEVLSQSHVSGPESIRKHLTHLAMFYAWAEQQGLPLVPATLTRGNLETYVSTGMADSSAKSRADRRSRLRAIADHLHPDEAPAEATIARPAVKPPYTQPEMAAIRQAALQLPDDLHRSRLLLCVGLGAGAGLGSADFRALRRRHLDDGGHHGLLVTVPGARPRAVPIRETYEDLVRAGLAGLYADDLLLGGGEDRKNLAARAVEDAQLLDDCPHIEQSRLRHTWLADLLAAAVPLRVILTAAGLRSARTLTDLTELLPPPPDSAYTVLRTPEALR